MGFNYLIHGDIDDHHAKFPDQPGWGTEETTGSGTRGIYEDDRNNGHMKQMDRQPEGVSIERGIKYFDSRKYLAGIFFWTGFDYRGEPNPLRWPAVSSQCGILDLCGFPKDIYYYLKSVWMDEPVLHIFPNWNWQGKKGKDISIWAYSNCNEVELFLNNKSLGKKTIEKLSHLEWIVPYQPGILTARGYNNKKEVISKKIETTGEPALIKLIPDRTIINADGEDISVITVRVEDSNGRIVTTADNEIFFEITGEGKIIGAGNGDPASHEPDKYFETIKTATITGLKELAVNDLNNRPEIGMEVDDNNWKEAFTTQSSNWREYTDSLIVVRGTFDLPGSKDAAEINLFTKSIVDDQSIYINGHLIAGNVKRDDPDQSYSLDPAILKTGRNTYAVTGQRFRKRHQWDEPNTDPGLLQLIYPSGQWKRKVFNGLAQIIIQAGFQHGEILINASSLGLKQGTVRVKTQHAFQREAMK
jgi:beta-galactosidase